MISFFSNWLIGVPIASYLTFKLKWSITGLMIGMAVMVVVQCLAYLVLLARANLEAIASFAKDNLLSESGRSHIFSSRSISLF